MLTRDTISDVTLCKIACDGRIASKSPRLFTTAARADINFRPCVSMSLRNSARVSGAVSKRRP
jgi:hypothetical protein